MLGCDRSGTSVVRRVLDSHSRIACPAEMKFMLQLLNIVSVEQSRVGLMSAGFTRREILDRLAVMIDSFLGDYAERFGKDIWVEKTTHNLFYADLLDEIFERDVRYLGLVRHGLDVAYSLENVEHAPFTVIERFREEGDDRAAAAMRFWRSQNGKLLALKGELGERLEVFKYEDIVRDPKAEFTRMFEFMGVPFEPEALDYNRHAHTGGYEDPTAVTSGRIEKGKSDFRRWEARKQRRLYAIAEVELNELGYGI